MCREPQALLVSLRVGVVGVHSCTDRNSTRRCLDCGRQLTVIEVARAERAQQRAECLDECTHNHKYAPGIDLTNDTVVGATHRKEWSKLGRQCRRVEVHLDINDTVGRLVAPLCWHTAGMCAPAA